MSRQNELYQKLCEQLKEIAVLRSCGALLSWDEQTTLPPKGGEHRANQLALLAGLVHERATAPVLSDLLNQLDETVPQGEEPAPMQANIREARRQFNRSIKLPRRLVEELSRVTTLSQQAWVQARARSEFAAFEPWLTQIVRLKQEEADALGSSSGIRYDALLEDYEPGATTSEIQQVFDGFRPPLVELVSAIAASGRQPDISILERHYPVDSQKAFSLLGARSIGFDFDAGRLDVAAHPFCSGIGPGDVRLTTRYNEYHFSGSFFGTLHEAGHGIYEQGLVEGDFGLPTGDACSLGIHESQSRLWENLVGRSRPFWDHFYPHAQAAFPGALQDVDIENFYGAINDVRPSWIRVEADEVTYNLHIMLRFQIEQGLISGTLPVSDLPAAWNEAFTRDFGMTPPDDALGCLQDVHWSAGLFGYFPTYSLGNLFASQFFDQAQSDLQDLAGEFRRGEFTPLRDWLRARIHQHGKRFSANELVQRVTGRPLSSEPLLRHLQAKFGEIYQL